MSAKKESHGKAGFFSGVLVLSASTIIVKVIGLAYKIPMISYLGAEGMGYFNSAYEIYAILCVISTAGLPVALSMLVSSYKEAKAYQKIKSVYRSALAVFLVLGVVGSLALITLAPAISASIDNEKAVYCIFAIAPSVLLVCVSSAIRGYFQGNGDMMPTAISQLIEALGKLIFGIAFAFYGVKRGYSIPIVAAFAVLGLSLGMFISTVYLIAKKLLHPIQKTDKDKSKQKSSYLTLLKIALPITLSSTVLSITRLVDMSLIMKRLQNIGYSAGLANEIYGAYSTIALPIFSLLPALITPISLSLIPVLSAAIERKATEDQADVAESAVRMTSIFSIPSSLAIILYASPIISLLFGEAGGEIDYIAPLLSVLAASIPFACLITTTNAVLQAYRKTIVPIVSMAIGALIKVVLAYVLIAIPEINVYGAPLSTFVCDTVITVINVSQIYKLTKKKSNVFSVYAKPLLSSGLAMTVSLLVYIPVLRMTNSEKMSFLVAAPIAVAVYFITAVLTKTISDEDIKMIPVLNKIIKRKKSDVSRS